MCSGFSAYISRSDYSIFFFVCFGVLAIVVELTIILKIKPVVFMNLAFREDKDASFARNRHGLDFFSASVPGT